MGPVTGLRIVNLRVREKVAYPDVTLDLAAGKPGHLVVGLENGGGKSTLLGAVYHVFVPEADQFLPRRAQRRQNKQGELKLLEQYVPGGDPTHFVVEVEPPMPDGTLPGITGQRVLLGACLWKPSGSSESVKADEFFWSARSVNRELSLRELVLRGPTGRLLDPREFKARLKHLRVELPAAQINIEELKGAWGMHLRSLGIDVEYVQQFLLRMNEDEGAADQVFTYASSRKFLESLVEVVGDPAAIDQLKVSLSATASDADTIVLDRRRLALLENLLAQTGPLAEALNELDVRNRERRTMVEHLLVCRNHLSSELRAVQDRAGEAAARRAHLDKLVTEARNAYGETNARHALAGVQVARLRLEASGREIAGSESELVEARKNERTMQCAAVLADRRTLQARVRDVEDVLKRKEVDAEPLRRSLSSSLRALEHRLVLEADRLHAEREELAALLVRAAESLSQAGKDLSKAERTLGTLDGERRTLGGERRGLEAEVSVAVEEGVLVDVAARASVELQRVRTLATAEKAVAEEQEDLLRHVAKDLETLAGRDRELVRDAARAEGDIERCGVELEQAVERSDVLASAIGTSGFIEIDPINLDEQSESIEERLGAVIESARKKQGGAAVSAAAAERSAMWLREHDRLPPRADVERLCEHARAERLGARPGWTYLAALPHDIGGRYAAAHPGLADGIVVNVPEDLQTVLALVNAARDELEGPVVIGPAGAFEGDIGEMGNGATVILPHSAYWSKDSGRAIADARTGDALRWRGIYDEAISRADAAIGLRQQLVEWRNDIGPGGLERRRTAVQRSVEVKRTIDIARTELAADVEKRAGDRDEAEARRSTALERVSAATLLGQRLEGLVRAQERQASIEARLVAIETEEATGIVSRDAALIAIAQAKRAQDDANDRIASIASELGGLGRDRTYASSLSAIVVRTGDDDSTEEEAADRLLLIQQVRDREQRWRGAVTDPELRAQISTHQAALAELDRRLGDYRDVDAAAKDAVAATPDRSADDFRRLADVARIRVEELVGRIGELKTTKQQVGFDLDKAQEHFKGLRRPAELSSEERADDVERAVVIRERLRQDRELALSLQVTREENQQAAAGVERVAEARVELVKRALERSSALLRSVVVGGALVPAIEVEVVEARLDIGALVASPGKPAWRRKLLDAVSRPPGQADAVFTLEGDKVAASAALDDVEQQIGRVQQTLSVLDTRAGVALDAAEALLRDATEDVVRGDRVVQTLRAAPRRTLADLARAHHQDIVQRHAAVEHHVATFDARVESLGETVYATIAALLREVRKTIQESELPDTRAMGRWAGADLLRLTGLDTLKVDQRRAAIGATLRRWFNPERPDDRPRRFDGNEVVHELLESVTPQFAASILIPSDPLDPEYKPIEHLAKETSGGEGVTVALILASLLASRRASARGHRRTTLLLDNPFAKVTKPEFLRLARDVAGELGVQLVAFTGIRDLAALSVFPRLTQLRVSRRQNANFVVPYAIEDQQLQPLLRNGTLFASPAELAAAEDGDDRAWPLMSTVTVAQRHGGESV